MFGVKIRYLDMLDIISSRWGDDLSNVRLWDNEVKVVGVFLIYDDIEFELDFDKGKVLVKKIWWEEWRFKWEKEKMKKYKYWKD